MRKPLLCVLTTLFLVQAAFAGPEPDEVRTYKQVNGHELTLYQTDQFLRSLDYLTGEPTIEKEQ